MPTPKWKMKQVELPGGGGIVIPADAAYKIERTANRETVVTEDGARVSIVRPAPKAAPAAPAAPAKPALTSEQMAEGITKALRPVLKTFGERIKELEARLAELERTSR